MAEKLLMIALSPTMEAGTIAKWTKKEGDSIKTGDIVCEVETDKATMEYESSQEGTLLKIVVPDGGNAKVGDLIGILGKAGEDFSALLAPGTPAAAPAPKPATATPLPAAQPVAQATAAVPPSGTVAPAASPAAPAHTGPLGTNGTGRIASPLARKLAAEKGIDLGLVQGSGPGGRVIKRDIESWKGSPARGASAPAIPGQAPQPAGADVRIPLGSRRAIIAKRLSESMFTAPHFYLKKTVNAEALIQARTLINSKATPTEKVSFNAFIIKLCGEALKRHPEINASWQGDAILQFGSIDIGLAVDLGNGLITPIIRNVAAKGVAQIDQELKTLIEKARANALKPEEFTGATFTISNLGSFGIEEFTAIINPPGSAILALGEVWKSPYVDANDEIKVASFMKLTLSCDHRVIDGASGAGFLADLAGILEEPVRSIF